MNSIEKLIEIFRDFPTVGPRTAQRFVFYLIKQPKEKISELISSIQELKNKIRLCSFCFNPHETSGDPAPAGLCPICSDSRRDRNLLCVVEKESDLLSIENTKKYKGLYFVLGGTVAAMKKSDIDNLRIKELQERVKNPANNFGEIIVATNPTPEGKATSVLVEKMLKEIRANFSAQGADVQDRSASGAGSASGWKITHLAKGLPVGGELEYADEETLESAFEGRK